MSKFAWVTLATNDSYSLGALVVAHSLKRVHTAHQLAVLITPGVSESMKNKLRTVFNLVEEVNLLDSKDKSNLALLKRPELGITFTKLHCWRLTQYEKCVFLDADTLVLRNCDELFEREELSAAPDVGWPDCFNSGVYVYKPNLETFSSLMEYAVSHGSFDGGDQGLLNSYFSDWAHKDIAKHLPFVYNTSSVASYSYLPAFKQFGQNTKILHFIGTAKPWLQNFNSETRKVYIPGGYQHLANFLQFWWDIFCEDVHSRLSADMSTEHWVENVQSRDQQGHWENPPQPAPQMPPTSDWQPEHYAEHHHHHPAEQQQHHDQSQGGTHTGHESGVSADGGGGGGGGGGNEFHQQEQKQQHQESHPQPEQQHQDGDGSGLAGALSQLHLGEPKSSEQEAYEEHMRRQCWESGNIDYMGRDSFDNIWRRIKQTLDEAAAAAAAKESTPPTPVRAISPAPMRFRHSSKSRSRSTTPKRDMRDRSPTPQPEDNVPVEKKEGYQQVITTKSPEGKTHTHTKTVYDPSVDEVDAPIKVTSAPVAETEQKATPPPVTSTSSSPPPRAEEVPTTKSTPPRVSASPKPQMPQPQQQQVAQETMAGKTPASTEPVKLIRRKRLSSPQATPPTATPPVTHALSSPSLPTAPKTVLTKTATAVKSPPKTSTTTTTSATKPTTTPSVATHHHSLPPALSRTRSAEPVTTAAANTDGAVTSEAVAPPPVPPRRKRESKVTRLAKFFRTFCTIL
ncbi:glycogenin-1 isoform X3 [Culex pipiens pallens]|uniref:glycogenin-1 isoform X3 n=1 Tax=Culex pipiens pallens TaxID=42434 RepID=UPI00195336AB|nr:glycogenin-1 isoform X3 [Culex pipiens pallens]